MSSDPQIDYTDPTLRDGISGGAEISGGNMTVQDAKDLALVLNIGALPVRLTVAEQRSVSATLGKDSLHQGLIAGIIGLGIVLIYMLALLPLPRPRGRPRAASCTASCSGGCSTSSR